ncbi:tetratricopeptide repeat protein [Vibrio sp. S9_S30]|uniref:ribonuclease E inhibitor RraB n=1 Tax=Vibrio sp. S9_S30 TaxID=2720226 RepID=UPI0016819A8C|nr:ribonuclease E inhibitor RraB [Vibrio sp. S9_S30]MBD1558723.1 tetratricopeptide repeat protein [Vibrio sp. S9_S30]
MNTITSLLKVTVKSVLCLLIVSASGNSMGNTYFTWDNFVSEFEAQKASSQDVYNNLVNNGLKDFSLLKFDFHFVSDSEVKLDALSVFLKSSYPYDFGEIIRREDRLWELAGVTNEIPVTKENLMYWTLDLYKRGYEFDAYFDAFGASLDKANQTFPDFENKKEDKFFDKGFNYYNSGNLSGAIFEWTNALQINPSEPNTLYSRAIVKNELYIWRAALRDYDRAIELAPRFASALLNRGSLKDDLSDHDGAIEDYNTVIRLYPEDAENLKDAYFNRGNSYHRLGVLEKSCLDWTKALEFGASHAGERLKQHCE